MRQVRSQCPGYSALMSHSICCIPDTADGVVEKRYTYGRLRYRQELEPALAKMLLLPLG